MGIKGFAIAVIPVEAFGKETLSSLKSKQTNKQMKKSISARKENATGKCVWGRTVSVKHVCVNDLKGFYHNLLKDRKYILYQFIQKHWLSLL